MREPCKLFSPDGFRPGSLRGEAGEKSSSVRKDRGQPRPRRPHRAPGHLRAPAYPERGPVPPGRGP